MKMLKIFGISALVILFGSLIYGGIITKEDVIVKNKGNIIILIMVKDETIRSKVEKGFDNL